MTYNNAIPQPGDRPSQSQSQLLANFADLKTFLDKNHVNLLDPSIDSGGLHKFLQMPEQSSDPATAVSQGALYTKDDGTRTALYWRQENNGTVIKLTGPNPVAGTAGQTFLPGGIGIKWGTFTKAGSFPSSGTITYTTLGLTAFSTTTYNVVMTFTGPTSSSTGDLFFTSGNATSFTWGFTGSSGASYSGFKWIAIGS